MLLYDSKHLMEPLMRYSKEHKLETHARIMKKASVRLREKGAHGTGVADIMKDAGLTHGGFYAHFPSREAMLAEAADRAGRESVATMERIAATSPPQRARQAMMEAYLSKAHVEGVETGCATAALGSGEPRR